MILSLGLLLSISLIGAPLLHSPDETGGGDLPPLVDGTQTRSVFDYVAQVGENGLSKKNIYPFSSLIKIISSMAGMNSTHSLRTILIPFSRALERQYASFKVPRALLGVDTYPQQDEKSLGLFLKDRLFVGFSHDPKVLEVISFNELANRFEFQLVTGYAKGEVSRVVYANRSLCITCHKNHGPMFSEGPWSETNGNPINAEEILKFQGGETHFQGIPVQVGSNDEAHNFDKATDRANLLMPLNEVWIGWCGGNLCRARFLQLGMKWFIDQEFEDSSELDELKKLLKSSFESQKLGFTIPNFNLVNRDPFQIKTEPNSSTSEGATADPKSRLEELIRQFALPDVLEPAKEACHIPPDESFGFPMTWDDPTTHGLFLIFSLDRFFSPADFTFLKSVAETPRIIRAIEDLIEDRVLDGVPLNRVKILNAICKKLGVEAPVSKMVSLGKPVVISDGREVHEVLGKDPRVAPFWNNCRECHLKFPLDFSQAKNDADILTMISNPRVAEKMINRLDWRTQMSPMPPKSSRQYKELRLDDEKAKNMRPSEREKMLEILRGFLKKSK